MISPEELAVLADLYARSAHNLDPFSLDARQANVEFLRKVDELYVNAKACGRCRNRSSSQD